MGAIKFIDRNVEKSLQGEHEVDEIDRVEFELITKRRCWVKALQRGSGGGFGKSAQHGGAELIIVHSNQAM